MGLLDKLRSGEASAAATALKPQAGAESVNRRASNGLKDFLWLLSDVRQGRVLDLGPVAQATVTFFTERGFKIYSEDLLRGWREFLAAEERRLRQAPVAVGEPAEAGFTRGLLAARFLETGFTYPQETFHAILLWDLLDYLDEELLPLAVARTYALLRPGGVVLGVFHNKKPEGFHRYRVLDADAIELVPAPALVPPLRQLQNRDLMNLFSVFRSSKTFVGRDQLREGLFLK
jgi:hypothetical protein